MTHARHSTPARVHVPLAFFIGDGNAGEKGPRSVQRLPTDFDIRGSLATSAHANGLVVEPLEFQLASAAVEIEWRPLLDWVLCALSRATTGHAHGDEEDPTDASLKVLQHMSERT